MIISQSWDEPSREASEPVAAPGGSCYPVFQVFSSD